MNLLVISESHGESAQHAASVLDSYLPRKGRRTWEGTISVEGADDLRTALTAKATRATAVIAHRTDSRRKSNIAFIVGNRTAFGPSGEVAVSTTKKPRRRMDRTHLERLIHPALGIATCLHDIGKLTVGFVMVLVEAVVGKKVKAQPVHHEMVSLVILWLAMKEHGGNSDQDFLEAISTPEKAVSVFFKALHQLPTMLSHAMVTALSEDGQGMDCYLPDRSTHPFMRGVADMVISHHLLMRGALNVDKKAPGGFRVAHFDTRHVRRWGKDACKPWKDFAEVHANARAALTDESTRWDRCISSDAVRACSVLRETPGMNTQAWTAVCYDYGRLALMLGDHQWSNAKVTHPASAEQSRRMAQATPYANTSRIESDRQPGVRGGELVDEDISGPAPGIYLADTWAQHVHKVRRRSLLALTHLLNPSDWPVVTNDELPAKIADREDPESMFSWQDRAADAIRAGVDGVHPDAWCIFVIAGVGTGKTIAIPKLAGAVAGERGLRMNLLLGQRNLTLQAGDEYVGQMGFSHEQALVSIGSATAQMLHEIARNGAGGEVPQQQEADSITRDVGTDAEEESIDDIQMGGLTDTGANRLALRTARMDRNPKKRERMLLTPILVSTIDRLMSAADARNGRHLGDTLRLVSGILALDELDSYQHEDFIAATRMIRIPVAHGQSLITSTATMRHGHFAVLRKIFAASRREMAALKGTTPSFGIAVVSEHGVDTWIDTASPAEAEQEKSSALYRAAASRTAEAISRSAVRRRATVIPVGKLSREACFKAAHDAAHDLHAGNCIVDPATGIRLSIGLARWNRVRSARGFAAFLATAKERPETKIAFACYHSKYALSVRHKVYGRLSAMLKRKCRQGESDPLLGDPDIRHQLELAAEQGSRDLICILSTSPIIEAGCDLDADWGITEPCSERSVMQFSGRIRRHRHWGYPEVNLAILDIAVPGSRPPPQPLEKPGAETPLGQDRGQPQFRAVLAKSKSASAIYPTEAWYERVDASRCLTDAPSPAGRAEVTMLEGACLGDYKAISQLMIAQPCDSRERPRAPETARVSALSSSAFAERPEILWSDYHPRWRGFRRQDSTDLLEVARDTETGKWLFRTEATSSKAKKDGNPAVAWMEMDDKLVPEYQEIDVNDPVRFSRLLFNSDIYVISKAANMVEEELVLKGVTRSSWLSRELRTASLEVFRKLGMSQIVYHCWFGFDGHV